MSILLSCYIKLYIYIYMYIYIYIQMHCFSGHDLLVQSGAGQQRKAPGARAAAKAEGKDSERFGILIDLHSSAVRSGKTPGTRTQSSCMRLAVLPWHVARKGGIIMMKNGIIVMSGTQGKGERVPARAAERASAHGRRIRRFEPLRTKSLSCSKALNAVKCIVNNALHVMVESVFHYLFLFVHDGVLLLSMMRSIAACMRGVLQ